MVQPGCKVSITLLPQGLVSIAELPKSHLNGHQPHRPRTGRFSRTRQPLVWAVKPGKQTLVRPKSYVCAARSRGRAEIVEGRWLSQRWRDPERPIGKPRFLLSDHQCRQ